MVRALLIAAVLLIGTASAADANRQEDTWQAEADIDATAMAALEDWYLFGTADTTPTTGQDIEPNQPVWYLWNEAVRVGQPPEWRQDRSGTSDPECVIVPNLAGVPPVFTDCVGNVVAVDLAWRSEGQDGIAYVLGVNDGDGEGSMQLFTSQAGLQDAFAFTGETLNDVAISGDGDYVAVATTVSGDELGDPDTGNLRLFNFNAGTLIWERPQDDPVMTVDIDVADNGATGRIVASSDSFFLGYDLGGTVFRQALGANLEATSVAVSHTATQWAVAGFTQGHVNLYGLETPQVYDRQANDNPDNEDIVQVAITADGRFYAAADSDGDLFLYNNEFTDLGSPGLLEKIDLGTTIHDLAFSHNGRYLVAAADSTVHFYRVSTGGLQEYWSDTRTGAVEHVDISGDGATVLATVGDTVHRYEEERKLTFTGPVSALTIEPGAKEQATVQLKNDGNRDVDIALSAVLPKDWGVEFDPKSVTLPPGGQQNVKVSLVAADGHPAGDEQVIIKAATGSGSQEVTLDVVVLQDRVWNVQSNGTLNVGLDAGGSATLTVLVTNEGNAVDETTIIATTDKEGWSVTAQPASVRLDPGEMTKVRIVVQAPSDAKELETAMIQVSALAEPDVVVDLTATVGANFGISFAGTLQGPLYPDERKSFELSVTNTGNAPDSIQIQTEGLPRGWDLIYPDGNNPYTVFSLQPGATTTIPVTVAVDDDAELANYQFRIRATSLGDSTQSQVVTITVAVEELPVEEPKDKKSPGAPVVLLVLALLAVAGTRRFRP
ncbi:MAG: NEW3 domain-containing protein [Thermoplasmatota archaeon]